MINNRCFECMNYMGNLSCIAFDTIPEEILDGTNDHSKPLPGQDNGAVFSDEKQYEPEKE